MGKKRSDKNSRRQARREKEQAAAAAPASPKPRAGVFDYWEPDLEGKVFGIKLGPTQVAAKLVNIEVDAVKGSQNLEFIRLEDTIQPVPLKFDPPLIDLAANKLGFQGSWERLTYLFDLPDPDSFQSLRSHMHEQDYAMLERFIATCRNLATYTVFNAKNPGVVVTAKGGGKLAVKADLPSHEQFAGVSATFRQLHNDGEEASFSKIQSRLQVAIKQLDEPARTEQRTVVSQWRAARAALMKKTVPTMICERIGEETGEMPDVLSYEGVEPETLIRQYNYGDTLHWGDYRDELADLTQDDGDEKFHKYAVLNSMINLGHLYFGFSVLLESALGYAKVTSASKKGIPMPLTQGDA